MFVVFWQNKDYLEHTDEQQRRFSKVFLWMTSFFGDALFCLQSFLFYFRFEQSCFKPTGAEYLILKGYILGGVMLFLLFAESKILFSYFLEVYLETATAHLMTLS